jgi:pimeloyl-ACP methyl ester carboxylesterase
MTMSHSLPSLLNVVPYLDWNQLMDSAAAVDWKLVAVRGAAAIFVAQFGAALIKSAFGLRRQLDTLETVVWGQGPDHQTIFLVAGFLDTARVYENNLVKLLASRYRLVGINYPGYTKATEDAFPMFGWSVPDQVRLLHATVQKVMKDDTSGKKPILVEGNTSTFAYSYPDLFERLIFVDIAPGNGIEEDALATSWRVCGLLFGTEFSSLPFVTAAFSLTYGCVSFSSFLLGRFFFPSRPFINSLFRFFAKAMKGSRYVRDPHNSEDKGGFEGINYLEGYLHLRYFFPWIIPFRTSIPGNVPMYRPTVPCFFAYGKQKPARFMSDTWLGYLASRTVIDGSKAIGYEGGHWFYTDPESASAKAFLADVEKFLASGR